MANDIKLGVTLYSFASEYITEKLSLEDLLRTSAEMGYEGVEIAYTTDSDSHKPIKYPGAVCTSAENADVAADFMNFCLTNADAQKVWAQYGFEMAAK